MHTQQGDRETARVMMRYGKRPVARFAPDVVPDAPVVTQAIETALADS